MIGTIFFPLSRVITAVVVFFTSTFSGAGLAAAVGSAPPSLDPLPYPAWVHEHLVWEHHGTQDSTIAFVRGFTSRDIPVGIVNVEADWATSRNSYDPHPDLYPRMQEMIDGFHAQGIKVLMWTCQMTNEKNWDGTDNPNYLYGKEQGYFLSGGKTVKWWGGNGALLDYTNPEAVRWHREQMDIIMDMGADGWKLDGTDPFIWLLFPAMGKNGFVRFRQYQRLSYSDFYEYTMEKTGGDGMAWARATDDTIGWGLPLNFMPRATNFAAWAGDQDNDWAGLRGALNTMFTSAMLNYVNLGSDIGGFRSTPIKPDPEDIFIRWAQLGAFSPIMNNGGGGEHRPWMYDERRGDEETYVTDIYREFTKLHHALIPYFSSQAAWSHERRQPVMRPTLGMYHYMLGDEIFVAPIYEEGNDRTVVFPAGEWIYMFDESKTYAGVKKLNFELHEYPAFIRKGAIIPMDHVGESFTTVRIYPANGANRFGLYEQSVKGSMISYTKNRDGLTISQTATGRQLLFRVFGEQAPSAITLDGAALPQAASLSALQRMEASAYFVDAGGILWIAVPDASTGIEIAVAAK